MPSGVALIGSRKSGSCRTTSSLGCFVGWVGWPRMARIISEVAASMGASPIAVKGLMVMQAPMLITRTVATTDRMIVVAVLRIA